MIALLWLLRALLAALFVYAGVAKLRDPVAFAIEITNYRLLQGLAPYLAATLPAVEVVSGLALVAAPRRWRHAAALIVAGLMLVFTAAVTSAVARGINLDCGCFGGGSGPVSWLTVGRDVALLGCAVAVLWFQRREAPR